jgi:hypothetical protein
MVSAMRVRAARLFGSWHKSCTIYSALLCLCNVSSIVLSCFCSVYLMSHLLFYHVYAMFLPCLSHVSSYVLSCLCYVYPMFHILFYHVSAMRVRAARFFLGLLNSCTIFSTLLCLCHVSSIVLSCFCYVYPMFHILFYYVYSMFMPCLSHVSFYVLSCLCYVYCMFHVLFNHFRLCECARRVFLGGGLIRARFIALCFVCAMFHLLFCHVSGMSNPRVQLRNAKMRIFNFCSCFFHI